MLRGWFNGQRGWAGMHVTVNAAGGNCSLTLSAELVASPIDEAQDGRIYVAALIPNGAIHLLPKLAGSTTPPVHCRNTLT